MEGMEINDLVKKLSGYFKSRPDFSINRPVRNLACFVREAVRILG